MSALTAQPLTHEQSSGATDPSQVPDTSEIFTPHEVRSSPTPAASRFENFKNFFKEHKIGVIATGAALVGAAAVGAYITHKTGMDFIPGLSDASSHEHSDAAHKVITLSLIHI